MARVVPALTGYRLDNHLLLIFPSFSPLLTSSSLIWFHPVKFLLSLLRPHSSPLAKSRHYHILAFGSESPSFSIMAIPSNLNNTKQIEFLYIVPNHLFEVEKPYNINRLPTSSSSIVYSPEPEIPPTNIFFESFPTEVTDLRSHQQFDLPDSDLETDGFIYAPFTSSLYMKPTYERESMIAYSKEMVDCLEKHVNADRIICYDMRVCDESASEISFLQSSGT